METVIAIVVTYNRQKLLAECVNAIRKQTRRVDKILIVNNGSTDSTELWLRQQAGLDFVTQKNIGSAGGFNTGIQRAYEQNFDWVWLMDDDGQPREDALENLLEGAEEKMCLRNCAVINIEDRKSFVWKTGDYTTIEEVNEEIIHNYAHPFNGTLIHHELIKKVGLPKKELFIWGDETEYYHRIITKYKIPFYTKTNSIHYHPASAYSYKNDWDYASNWKMYFYVRNRFHILKTRFSDSRVTPLLMYFVFLLLFAGIILVFQKSNKLKKLNFILWPVKDAFLNNCEVTPAMVIERLHPSTRSSRRYFQPQFRDLKKSFLPSALSRM